MSLELVGKKSIYRVTQTDPWAYGRLSVILRAVDSKTNEEVILKRFRQPVTGASSLNEFFHEIQIIERLSHPNVLQILDYGNEKNGDKAPFIVLPFMKGGNLREFLRGRTFSPIEMVQPLLLQVAKAVDFTHSVGIIHGDIKPENILLNEQHNTAFLSDFGLSRHFDVIDKMFVSRAAASQPATPKGGVGGTSAYLSPEQLSDNIQTPKSDIYSLGLVAYELLVGRLPFDINAPLYRQVHSRVMGELVPPEEANPRLSSHVSTALRLVLDTDPKKRPSNATEFVAMLWPGKRWDIFIAHASHDASIAERLFEALRKQVNVFLDIRCLKLGDDWDAELVKAQNDSLVTVVLVSPQSDEAYYAREEISRAINMARKNPNAHRVVPVFTNHEALMNPPYGLALKQGLTLDNTNNVQTISDKLCKLAWSLKSSLHV